jgi:hypothetical protein
MASSISAGTTSSTALVATADTSGALELKTNNGTTALTLSTAQVATFAATAILPTTLGVGGATPSTSGSGITFPATASASSNANTLDDYEEGTWTPTLTFSSGSVTYQDQTGQYTKVGNLVTVSFWIRTGAVSSPSGAITITGLPFNANGTQSRPAVLFRARSLSGVTGVIGAWLGTNSNALSVEIQNNGSGSDLNANTLVNGSELDAFFSYHT